MFEVGCGLEQPRLHAVLHLRVFILTFLYSDESRTETAPFIPRIQELCLWRSLTSETCYTSNREFGKVSNVFLTAEWCGMEGRRQIGMQTSSERTFRFNGVIKIWDIEKNLENHVGQSVYRNALFIGYLSFSINCFHSSVSTKVIRQYFAKVTHACSLDKKGHILVNLEQF